MRGGSPQSAGVARDAEGGGSRAGSMLKSAWKKPLPAAVQPVCPSQMCRARGRQGGARGNAVQRGVHGRQHMKAGVAERRSIWGAGGVSPSGACALGPSECFGAGAWVGWTRALTGNPSLRIVCMFVSPHLADRDFSAVVLAVQGLSWSLTLFRLFRLLACLTLTAR